MPPSKSGQAYNPGHRSNDSADTMEKGLFEDGSPGRAPREDDDDEIKKSFDSTPEWAMQLSDNNPTPKDNSTSIGLSAKQREKLPATDANNKLKEEEEDEKKQQEKQQELQQMINAAVQEALPQALQNVIEKELPQLVASMLPAVLEEALNNSLPQSVDLKLPALVDSRLAGVVGEALRQHVDRQAQDMADIREASRAMSAGFQAATNAANTLAGLAPIVLAPAAGAAPRNVLQKFKNGLRSFAGVNWAREAAAVPGAILTHVFWGHDASPIQRLMFALLIITVGLGAAQVYFGHEGVKWAEKSFKLAFHESMKANSTKG